MSQSDKFYEDFSKHRTLLPDKILYDDILNFLLDVETEANPRSTQTYNNWKNRYIIQSSSITYFVAVILSKLKKKTLSFSVATNV
jgi:hypothetical protein